MQHSRNPCVVCRRLFRTLAGVICVLVGMGAGPVSPVLARDQSTGKGMITIIDSKNSPDKGQVRERAGRGAGGGKPSKAKSKEGGQTPGDTRETKAAPAPGTPPPPEAPPLVPALPVQGAGSPAPQPQLQPQPASAPAQAPVPKGAPSPLPSDAAATSPPPQVSCPNTEFIVSVESHPSAGAGGSRGEGRGSGSAGALSAQEEELFKLWRREVKQTLGEGDYDEGVAKLQAMIDRFPDKTEGYLYLASVYLKDGRNQKGIEILNKCVTRLPDTDQAWYLLGLAWRRNGQFNEAKAAYEYYLSREPDDPDTYYGLGETYNELGEYPAAVEAYSQYIRRERRASETMWVNDAKMKVWLLRGSLGGVRGKVIGSPYGGQMVKREGRVGGKKRSGQGRSSEGVTTRDELPEQPTTNEPSGGLPPMVAPLDYSEGAPQVDGVLPELLPDK